jgi:hypothetical protein
VQQHGLCVSWGFVMKKTWFVVWQVIKGFSKVICRMAGVQQDSYSSILVHIVELIRSWVMMLNRSIKICTAGCVQVL